MNPVRFAKGGAPLRPVSVRRRCIACSPRGPRPRAFVAGAWKQTAGRALFPDEVELRNVWIALVYLTLEQARWPQRVQRPHEISAQYMVRTESVSDRGGDMRWYERAAIRPCPPSTRARGIHILVLTHQARGGGRK